MPVTGRLFKITQLDRFVASYLADPSRPDPTTFVPLGNARVRLLIRREGAAARARVRHRRRRHVRPARPGVAGAGADGGAASSCTAGSRS